MSLACNSNTGKAISLKVRLMPETNEQLSGN